MNKENRRETLRIYESGIKIDNELWVTRCPGNELYKISLQDKSIKLIERFAGKQNEKLFIDIAYDGDAILFLVPFMAEQLMIYNMKKHTTQSIKCKESAETRYVLGVVDTGYIYLFPKAMGGIARINIEDGRTEYRYNLISYLTEHISYENQIFYAHYFFKEKLYLPLIENSILIEYDCNNDKFNLYDIDTMDNIGIYDCMGIGEELYLLDRYGTVYCFNIISKKVQKIFSLKDGMLQPYSSIKVNHNEIWLIPYSKDKIAIYSFLTNEVEFLDIIPSESKEKYYKKVFFEAGKLWLYPNLTKSLIEIDMDTRQMQGYKMTYSNTISEFISKLPASEKKENSMGQFGEIIYRTLKS